MTRIRLTSLSKRFGTRLALDHLDLTIESGGFTVLVGPSGCGRTITLRLVSSKQPFEKSPMSSACLPYPL